MSTRTKFILTVVALLAVFVVIEYRMPRKFQWVPTFSHQDAQPFGCMVFDSVLSASMPHGYTVTRNSLWQMEEDSLFADGPKGVVIISTEDIDNQIKRVLDLVGKGNTVMVAATDLYRWVDTLGADFNYHRSFKLSDIAGKRPEKCVLRLMDNDSVRCSNDNAFNEIKVYEQLIERSLDIPDSVACEILACYRFYDEKEVKPMDEDENGKMNHIWRPVAASFPIGKGELILVSVPLLMTNYGMVSGDGHRFIAYMMSRMKHLPVIRTESCMSATAHEEQSPLYVLLQQPPLRWALYLTMISLLLFCFFTARRRQRVIPVVTKPSNANLEFVRLIGTLYWQRHNNADLLAKKLAFTTEELQRQLNIDLNATASGAFSVGGDDALHLLAAHTGRDTEELRLLLHNIQQAASGNYTVSDAELKTFIEELDSLAHAP